RGVTDGQGRMVRVPERVTRVVALAPSATEIVYALGAGPAVVGLDRFSDYPPETKQVEKVGGDVEPSLERIVALKPDVVFTATTANTLATVRALERLGIAVYVSRPDSVEEVYRDVRGIADALGRHEAGVRLTDEMRARIERVRAAHAEGPRVPTLLVVWAEPLVVVGKGSHVAELLAIAGGRNVAGDAEQPFPTYSVERVLARAPEVLIVGTHAEGAPPMRSLERLTTLPAVRNRRIHLVDGDLMFRPGPRLPDGAEAIARVLHPAAGDGGAR
ncbi:MAG TPA: helical backbone metal receptor, partial [Kofleriaceae bacterium]|nr:helical backbone metal receptor [Kofleriaceae bacterium]